MEEPSNPIVETREEFMISPTIEENPLLKTAHFVKPSINSIQDPIFDFPSHRELKLDPKKFDSCVNLCGWTSPGEKWKEWVDKMAAIHGSTWKKTGIYEAIMSSKCKIFKHNDLVYKLVDKWCPETSSFIFPWGEVTITLEDMLAFGFPVLGLPVFSPLETEELKAIEERLERSRLELSRGVAKKALNCSWLKEFMDSESASDIEHEAFLAMWLSRYVLANSGVAMRSHTFPIAIRLARGVRIALAPAVLASIYRDLRLFKEKFVELASLESNQMDCDVSTLWVKSPFHLVQVWVWERFVGFRPQPRLLAAGEPRLARWNMSKHNTENVSLVFDSTKPSYKWRPYVETILNWELPMCYGENSVWVRMDPSAHDELMLFAKCLRASSLVGLECRENYYPHRVAMQFGFDQDLPGLVDQFSGVDEIAWQQFDRPFDGVELYVPSRAAEGCVTTRYMEWWKQSMSKLQDATINVGLQRWSLTPASKSKGKKKKSNKNIASCLEIKPTISKEKRAGDSLRKIKRAARSNKQTLTPVSNSSTDTTEFDQYISDEKQGVGACDDCTGGDNYIQSFNITSNSSQEIKEGSDTFMYDSGVGPSSTEKESKLRSSLLKEINQSSAPPVFSAGNSTPNMTIHEILGLNKNHSKQCGDVEVGGNGSCFSFLSHTGADSILEQLKSSGKWFPEGEAVRVLEDVIEAGNKVLPAETIKRVKAMISAFEGVVEDTNCSNAESITDSISEGSHSGGCCSKKYDMLVLELVARVCELEKVVTELKEELKAARSG